MGTGLLSLSQADPEKIEKTLATLSKMKGFPSLANIDATPFAAFPMKAMQEGGLVQQTGPAFLHKDEIVFDQQAAGMMVKAAQLMADSGAMNSAGLGGAPVIINNNNVDNSMQSSQTTAVSIPAPTRSNESTLRALQAA